MRENIRCVYVREYSELPGLQKAGTVQYELREYDGRYHLCTTRMPGGKAGNFCLSGVSENAARDLLRFLYENSVEPELALAVAQDCMEEPARVWQTAAESGNC